MQNDFFSHYMKLTPHIVDAKRGQRLKIMKALNKVAPFLTLKLPCNVWWVYSALSSSTIAIEMNKQWTIQKSCKNMDKKQTLWLILS